MKMLVKEKRDQSLDLKGQGNKNNTAKDSFVSIIYCKLQQNELVDKVPNPFGHDAGRGAMEGVGEDEWIVTKDKVSFLFSSSLNSYCCTTLTINSSLVTEDSQIIT